VSSVRLQRQLAGGVAKVAPQSRVLMWAGSLGRGWPPSCRAG
jgi:hypothetical protein